MSMYWAGYYGSGLVLTGDEITDFLSNYDEIHHTDFLNDTEDLWDGEIGLFWSDNSNCVFYPAHIDPDMCEGMRLIPYYHRGTTNKGPSFQEYSFSDEECLVLFSDYDLDGPDAFVNKPYESYEAFVQEFKNKAAKYLPEDFDWDSHIGRFTYACFA